MLNYWLKYLIFFLLFKWPSKSYKLHNSRTKKQTHFFLHTQPPISTCSSIRAGFTIAAPAILAVSSFVRVHTSRHVEQIIKRRSTTAVLFGVSTEVSAASVHVSRADVLESGHHEVVDFYALTVVVDSANEAWFYLDWLFAFHWDWVEFVVFEAVTWVWGSAWKKRRSDFEYCGVVFDGYSIMIGMRRKLVISRWSWCHDCTTK